MALSCSHCGRLIRPGGRLRDQALRGQGRVHEGRAGPLPPGPAGVLGLLPRPPPGAGIDPGTRPRHAATARGGVPQPNRPRGAVFITLIPSRPTLGHNRPAFPCPATATPPGRPSEPARRAKTMPPRPGTRPPPGGQRESLQIGGVRSLARHSGPAQDSGPAQGDHCRVLSFAILRRGRPCPGR